MVNYFKRSFFAEGQNPIRKQIPFHVVLSQERMSGNMKTVVIFTNEIFLSAGSIAKLTLAPIRGLKITICAVFLAVLLQLH